MKTTRVFSLSLALGALLAATACDDQTAPADSGTVSFQITLEPPPTDIAPTAMPDFPVGRKGEPVHGSGALHFASAGPGSDTTTLTPSWDSTALASALPPTIDAVVVRLVGSSGTETVTMTQQGNAFVGTSTQLAAGSYSAIVVGSEGGLATYYAQQAITITGGDVSATINLGLFVPTLQPFQSPTTFTSVAAVFTTVAGATGYAIEVDTDPAFANPTTIPTTASPTGLFSTDPGLFYLRVRAENAIITTGQAMPSNVESIEIVTDSTTGDSPGTALPVGTGVLDSLNILPAGDEDWFTINLSAGDALSAGVYAAALSPASTLDPTLTLLNAALDTIAFNDDDPAGGGTTDSYLDAIPILTADTYYLVVAGFDSSTGHYELDISLANAISTVTVVPGADTVAVAGDTTRLVATAYDGNGNPFTGVTFTWASSDNNIATVDSTGLVTTVAQGTATITALAQDGVTAGTATVTALLPPIDEVRLDRDADAFTGPGGTASFTATAYSAGNPIGGITFTWFTLDTNVATIDQAGMVTSAGGGQTVVGAAAGGFSDYATITVDDPEGTPITLFAREASGTTNQLEGAYGFSSTDFYAFGNNVFLRYDGNSWSTAATPAASVNDMWGGSRTTGIVVGSGGYAARWDGTNLTSSATGSTEDLWGVWGASPADVFAVGSNGAILHNDGTGWSSQTSGTAALLWDVWGNAASDVYAVGTGGTILHYDGANWSSMTSGTTEDLNGVWGAAPDSIYAVGENGTVLVYNGTGWSPVTTGATGTLTSIWGTGSSDVYISGFGENWYFDGSTWWNIATDSFERIYGSTNPVIFGVGGGGLIKQAYRGALLQANAAVDTLVAIDDTVSVVVSVTDTLGAPISGVGLTWSSSDSSVAIPDASGLVTAIAEGTADITAQSTSLSDIFTIDVYQMVSTVTMSPDTLVIGIGVTDTVVASPFDANGYPIPNRATVWASTDNGVATVDPDSGYVDGVQTGGAVISADVDGVVGNTTVFVPLANVVNTTTAAGYDHACGLDAGGNAWCWGHNDYGQLGDGTTGSTSSPVAVSGGLTFRALTAGNYHTCGITTGYRIYCWGANGNGQLGNGDFQDQLAPVAVTANNLFVDVDGGDSHTCALTLIGRAWCWGRNGQGQLGNGGAGSSPNPVAVFGGKTWQSISAGSRHSCGVDILGGAWCWGDNGRGQLGDGNTGTTSTIPLAVSQGMLSFERISTGYDNSCALDTTGAAHCWGYNWAGQLGVGDNLDRTTPTAVLGGLAFRSIAGGYYHTCAVTPADAAYCWGYNNSGQIGNGSTSYPNTPAAVSGGHAFASVSPSYQTTCGREGGTMYCWGDGSRGQTGSGQPLAETPQPVTGGVSFLSIQGGYSHSCGLDTGNAAWCWGRGTSGQLGNGAFVSDSVPVSVTGPALSMLRSGGSHTCGIGVADSLSYCWGYGGNGQLGNASTSNNNVPVTSTGGGKWKVIDAGESHTCAIDIANSPVCWGYNYYGQLGQGTSGNGTDLTIPSVVSGGLTMIDIVGGGYHTCGILAADSTAYCWGWNSDGQLGEGTQNDASTPQAVSGGIRFLSLTAGYYHTCGIAVADSTGYCWGSGGNNGTGTGTVSVPTPISGGYKFRQIEANLSYHTCGVTYADEVYCWGDNYYGQLGTGTAQFESLPTLQTAGLSGAVLGAGNYHSCAADGSNIGYCWGYNRDAQLGLGFTSIHLMPEPVTGGITFATPPPATGGGTDH